MANYPLDVLGKPLPGWEPLQALVNFDRAWQDSQEEAQRQDTKIVSHGRTRFATYGEIGLDDPGNNINAAGAPVQSDLTKTLNLEAR